MAPGVLDLTWRYSAAVPTPPDGKLPAMYRGDSYAATIRFWEDPPTNTVPFVLDPLGTYSAQVRTTRLRTPTAGAPILEFVVAVGGVDGNELTFSVDAVTTLAVPESFTKGFWDVQQDLGGGIVTTFFRGKVLFDPDVTRV